MARRTEPRNVLITRFSALGDVAMTIPVVYGACAANPATRFIFLTRKLPAKMFLQAPPNLVVRSVDLQAYKGISGMRRLLGEMVEEYGVDAVVDLHNVLRTKIIRFFASLRGIPAAAVDKGRRARQALTRRRNKTVVQLTPMIQRYADVFDRLHIRVADSFSTIFPGRAADPAMFKAVTSPKKDGETWIAIAPFAAHAGKVYPLDLLKKVVDHYASMPGYRLFIFGAGEKEIAEIDSLADGRENVLSMAKAAIGIPGEMALMSHCRVMLAMDSANMHMASLTGTPVVSIWGATHPFTGFYGFRQDPADAVQLEMVCRPCSIFGNKPCARGDYYCLRGISPQLIISRIDAKLNNDSKPK